MAVDLEVVPGLVCGQTYRNAETEQATPAWRKSEVTRWTGCGGPMTWLSAYRCRQCGRWIHGQCLDWHFATPED